jgi:hypothetical protein
MSAGFANDGIKRLSVTSDTRLKSANARLRAEGFTVPEFITLRPDSRTASKGDALVIE